MASEDKMQDVFPVNFDFVKGEQPTASKLSAWVKQTDTGFSRMTRAIGDPWDYSAHSGAGGAYTLSPEKLAQTSIARFCGPSDYAAPRGASFQDGITTSCTVTLAAYRNQWRLGFPLVKLLSDIDISDTGSGKVTNMVWGTDIEGPEADSPFVTLKTSLEDLAETGDFHIEYNTGVITCYTETSSSTVITINDINMLGPGSPWASANVIPHWTQTSSLCYVTIVTSTGGTTLYNIALPKVETDARDTVEASIIGAAVAYGDTAESAWSISATGESAYYRMPYQFINSMAANDEIPVGAIYVYDEAQARILSVTAFYYYDEHNVRCEAPDGWLTEGNTVRIITMGSSLAEDVQFLMSAFRDNCHTGLSRGQKGDTLHYTPPISHDDLTDLYCGSIPSAYSAVAHYLFFRKSDIPLNPHPQYLHRVGYAAADADGNSGNAMRGWIVFAGMDTDFTISTSLTEGGTLNNTFGLMFGGADASGVNGACRIAFDGGLNDTTWDVGDAAVRHGFNITAVGGVPATAYGALSYTPWYGTPLYLRGYYGETYTEWGGGMLGFDLCQNGEMNYIKMMPAVRTGTYDQPNLPVRDGQTETDPLAITPLIGDGAAWQRLSAAQIREFRFRGCSWNKNAYNAAMSIGNGVKATLDDTYSLDPTAKYATYGALNNVLTFSVLTVPPTMFRIGDTITLSGFAANNGVALTITAVGVEVGVTWVTVSTSLTTENPAPVAARVSVSANEFNQYFTSPGMVGCDFLNLYSNAIFFSDTGDGKVTSFTSHGTNWMRSDGTQPTGIYFAPGIGEMGPYFSFCLYDTNHAASTVPLSFGDHYGFRYYSYGTAARVQFSQGEVPTEDIIDTGYNGIFVDDRMELRVYDGDLRFYASDDITVAAGSDITMTAVSWMRATAAQFRVCATGEAGLYGSSSFDSYAPTGDYYTKLTLDDEGTLTAAAYDTGIDHNSILTMRPTSTSLTVDGAISLIAAGAGGYISLKSDDEYIKVESNDTYIKVEDGTIQLRKSDSVSDPSVTISTAGVYIFASGAAGDYIILNCQVLSTPSPVGLTDGTFVIDRDAHKIRIVVDGAWVDLGSW